MDKFKMHGIVPEELLGNASSAPKKDNMGIVGSTDLSSADRSSNEVKSSLQEVHDVSHEEGPSVSDGNETRVQRQHSRWNHPLAHPPPCLWRHKLQCAVNTEPIKELSTITEGACVLFQCSSSCNTEQSKSVTEEKSKNSESSEILGDEDITEIVRDVLRRVLITSTLACTKVAQQSDDEISVSEVLIPGLSHDTESRNFTASSPQPIEFESTIEAPVRETLRRSEAAKTDSSQTGQNGTPNSKVQSSLLPNMKRKLSTEKSWKLNEDQAMKMKRCYVKLHRLGEMKKGCNDQHDETQATLFSESSQIKRQTHWAHSHKKTADENTNPSALGNLDVKHTSNTQSKTSGKTRSCNERSKSRSQHRKPFSCKLDISSEFTPVELHRLGEMKKGCNDQHDETQATLFSELSQIKRQTHWAHSHKKTADENTNPSALGNLDVKHTSNTQSKTSGKTRSCNERSKSRSRRRKPFSCKPDISSEFTPVELHRLGEMKKGCNDQHDETQATLFSELSQIKRQTHWAHSHKKTADENTNPSALGNLDVKHTSNTQSKTSGKTRSCNERSKSRSRRRKPFSCKPDISSEFTPVELHRLGEMKKGCNDQHDETQATLFSELSQIKRQTHWAHSHKKTADENTNPSALGSLDVKHTSNTQSKTSGKTRSCNERSKSRSRCRKPFSCKLDISSEFSPVELHRLGEMKKGCNDQHDETQATLFSESSQIKRQTHWAHSHKKTADENTNPSALGNLDVKHTSNTQSKTSGKTRSCNERSKSRSRHRKLFSCNLDVTSEFTPVETEIMPHLSPASIVRSHRL